jgi:hypothetical protein
MNSPAIYFPGKQKAEKKKYLEKRTRRSSDANNSRAVCFGIFQSSSLEVFSLTFAAEIMRCKYKTN